MADPNDAPPDDPFAKIYSSPAQPQANNDDADADNPFSKIMPPPIAPETTAGGAFRRGVQRSVLPAAGGLVGAGAGAEAGALAGGAVGLAFPPAAPFTVAGGALVGGVLGFFGGSYATEAAQHYALSKAPDGWKEAIGMDDRQQRLDEAAHPTASFLGGLTPYALTLRPGNLAKGALPENATAVQRIMANPITARVFGGAAMGGMELGQEAYAGQSPDWSKVAISTGFGVVFNKPTRLGQSLTEIGGAPVRALAGRPSPVTVAQAGDAKVMGPGITEEVFQGTHQQDPSAEMAAQETARTEQAATGQPAGEPDYHAAARSLEPELFHQYDTLSAQRDEFRRTIAEQSNPSPEAIADLRQQREAAQAQLDAHVEARNGYASGPEARRLRAQVRALDAEQNALLDRRQAFLEGRGEDTPEMAQARQHLMAVDVQMRDLAPEVSAAYRRASEGQLPDVAETTPPSEGATPPPPTAISPEIAAAPPVAPPPDTVAIVADVTKQLTQAGRPLEEAHAAAQLIAARYATRAARFKGVLGTAEELYRNEGAEIRGASGAQKPVAGIAEAPAARAGYERWIPGENVAVGPIAGLQVISREGNSFVLKRNATEQVFRFTPPEKMPRDPAGLLEHLVPVEGEEAKELAQGKTLEQDRLGKIRLAEGRRPIITLMKDANASTFIHESGHDFLEQLMRDADHEKAPDSIKDDALTVRDWLGVQGREDIKTRHHEKFARGFEQYMREGVAPSEKLASVFQQFKDWLTQIYQTIKSLGKPINEDIRQVFDRMLAEEPQRTVYATEQERAPTLHDIHAADANLTEPHEAEPAMDRVIAETTQTETTPPPEIAHEIENVVAKTEAAQPAGENAGGAEQTAEVGADRGGPGTEPASGSVGSGDKPIVGSGGEARAEGAGVSGPEQRRSSDAVPLSPEPKPVFGADESPYLDKAGNIRTENLTTSEDVARAIHDAADANNDFIGNRRGIVSDGQVMELADALGMDYETLNTRKIGEAFNAEQIMAARKLLIKSASEVSAAMKKAAIGTDEDVLTYALARDRHQMIQGQVAGITAEAGRALRAFRNISAESGGVDEFIKQATGKTLFQMRQEAKLGATLETPEQVSKFMNDAKKPSYGRMILEYWVNGLISGPITHSTYAVGNTILALEKLGPETAAASAIGAVRRAMGREGQTVRIGEIAAQLHGVRSGLAPALKASIESLRQGTTALLPGEQRRMAMPFQPGAELAAFPLVDEVANFHDVASAAFGLIRGIRDGILSTGAILKGGVEGSPLISTEYSSLGAIPDINIRGVNVLPIGSAVRLPGRFIASIHSFYRTMNYSIDKNALAYRDAANAGLTGEAMDKRVAELRQNPTPELMDAARKEATDLTLMGQGSKFTQALSRLTNTEVFGFPILKFIDPFVHIGSNIIDQAIVKRTPVGILSPELRADLLGKNGTIAQDKAQARMLVGTAFAVTVGSLAAEGYVSGSGPSDPHEAAMWRLAGNQAHSVRIGDIWYDAHRLGPMGMLLGIGADMYDVAHAANEGEFTKAAAHFQHAVTQNVLDESFMRGPSDLIKAIEDPGRYGEAYVRNFLSSFVPYSVGVSQLAHTADPYSRQARTVVDAMKAKIPGLSETLLPRLDIWGMPVPSREGLGGLTAIYAQHISQDPVNQEMVKLGLHPGQVERQIRNVRLTDDQYQMYAQYAGRMLKSRLDAFVRAPDWQHFPDESKRDVIQAQVRASREVAAGAVMSRWPDIPQRAVQAKLAKRRGEKPE